MAKVRRSQRDASFPSVSSTAEYKPGGDGDLLLIYNARGGIYRAIVAEADEATTREAPEGDDELGVRPPKVDRRGLGERGMTVKTISYSFLPGLNLVGAETFAKLRAAKGLETRIDNGEIVEVGAVDDWGDVKPTRALDYIRQTGSLEALRAIAEVENRDKVADALAKQLAEVQGDGGLRSRVRRQARAHTIRGAE